MKIKQTCRIYAFLILFMISWPMMAQEIFFDDFSNGLDKWIVGTKDYFRIVDTGDRNYGEALKMFPGTPFPYALIKNSENWQRYEVRGDVLFPDSGHSYMALIYHYVEDGERADMGSIYIKGNGSYIRVNPRFDRNPLRTLYEEFKTPLTGKAAVKIGEWQRFKAEIFDNICHFYVGDMETPQVTFDAFPFSRGMFGFKPRVVGAPAVIDNIKVRGIEQLSYQGAPRPNIAYAPENLTTDWEVIGPFDGAQLAIETGEISGEERYYKDGNAYRWEKFSTDKRGCLVTAKITGFTQGETVAYFRTIIEADEPREMTLDFSTREDLALWLNGEFLGYAYTDRYAWYDFRTNPEHNSGASTHQIPKGKSELIIRVRGGEYAGGGFFIYVE